MQHADIPEVDDADLVMVPPDDIKKIMDKTARMAASCGEIFHQRLKDEQQNNAMFAFLLPTNPWNLYYENKVWEFQTDLGTPIQGDDVPIRSSRRHQ